MFGKINSWELVGLIAEGHFNEITKRENELSESRMKICRECPLYSESILGPVCDSKKCLNTKTGELVQYPGKDVICGCSCRLNAKTKVKNARCVLNKW